MSVPYYVPPMTNAPAPVQSTASASSESTLHQSTNSPSPSSLQVAPAASSSKLNAQANAVNTFGNHQASPNLTGLGNPPPLAPRNRTGSDKGVRPLTWHSRTASQGSLRLCQSGQRHTQDTSATQTLNTQITSSTCKDCGLNANGPIATQSNGAQTDGPRTLAAAYLGENLRIDPDTRPMPRPPAEQAETQTETESSIHTEKIQDVPVPKASPETIDTGLLECTLHLLIKFTL